MTPEKLSNFVEYIDCFILIACPQSSFEDHKALMRPIVSPLDIKIAFDPNYKWDMSYSFDNNFILSKPIEVEKKKEDDKDIDEKENLEEGLDK